MRWLNRPVYSLLLRLATPLLLLRLYLRGHKEAAYAQHISQRLGFYGDLQPVRGALWLHAVSLGEMRTAALFIQQWRAQNPEAPLLLTCSTATGRAEGEKLLDARTQLVWLPWDMPGAVGRFLKAFKPKLGLLMETEVWPNLSHACAGSALPLILMNARLSEKSLHKALRLSRLALPAYAALTAALAQSENDAQRLRQLGCKILGVTGNIKFDIHIHTEQIQQAQALKAQWGNPNIISLASSREGEEALFLEALEKCDLSPNTLPLIVPRHPQRFEEIAHYAQKAGWNLLRRRDFSSIHTLPPRTFPPRTLLLGDSMGEMAFYYSLSQITLMGGSFLPFGGQNLIEALACHCPVILGPSTYNFAEASAEAIKHAIAFPAENMPQALNIALEKIHEPRPNAAFFSAYLENNQGAIQKTLAAIAPFFLEHR